MTSLEQFNAFLADVSASTSKFTEKRSSLKDLFAFLRAAIKTEGVTNTRPARLLNTAAAKAKCGSATDTRLRKYEPALRRLVQCWGTAADYPPRPISALTLINAVRDELDQCKTFACNDATTFAGNINPRVDSEAILARARKSGVPVAMPAAPGDGTWNASHLKNAKEKVYSTKCGECTNFGKAAAHVLATTPLTGARPRIELVAWEARKEKLVTRPNGSTYTKVDVVAHVYCVVNREGGTEEVTVGRQTRRQLPGASTWGDDCWIVDPWLASLGWNSCFKLSEYPFAGFLAPVYMEMDSTMVE